MAQVYATASQLPKNFAVSDLPKKPHPEQVLLCSPDYFKVVDVKNPFMKESVGKVNETAARQQWEALKSTFDRIGITTHVLEPQPGCEDMVFTANPIFVGTKIGGERLALESRMRYPSRQPEVAPISKWFAAQGFKIHRLTDPNLVFEGGGDALWHPGRHLVWGGIGPRTQREVYSSLSTLFEVDVCTLNLVTDSFYHLDTCFCPLNTDTVLLYPEAFDSKGLDLIYALFKEVITATRSEALSWMACNAAAFSEGRVVIQEGSDRLVGKLREKGYKIQEVNTGEFLKSGGSVFCMKHAF